MSTLLTYICDQTLQGRGRELNEQKIGTALFGRPPEYDSSADGIVRTQASRLRKQLDSYFGGEGEDEPLVITIPRGGYVPYFEARLPSRAVSRPEVQPIAEPPRAPAVRVAPSSNPAPAGQNFKPRVKTLFLTWIPALVFVLLCSSFLFISLHQRSNAAHEDTTSRLFWSRLFREDLHTAVVVGDSGLVMWHAANEEPLALTDYVHGSYRTETSKQEISNALSINDLSNRRYTSMVDLEIVHALDAIANKYRAESDVRFARDIHPNDLKHANVVLIGAPEANPWFGLYDSRLNFYFENDRNHQVMSVVNRTPRIGEPRRWDSARVDQQHNVFGIVAFLSNIGGDGNVLLLAGTSMAGTESSWDFVSNQQQFIEFVNKLRMSSKDHLPHFEAVIGTNSLDGSAAKTTVLAWRQLD